MTHAVFGHTQKKYFAVPDRIITCDSYLSILNFHILIIFVMIISIENILLLRVKF